MVPHTTGMSSLTDRPNVLVVVCDTLRPDYLSTYGGKFETPFFDWLADAGTLFENAYAAGPGSSISHAALFTGQYPSTSGVGGQVDVPPDIPHIAEHFRDAGYNTFGMPGPSRIGSHWNYDRGFNEYLEKWVDIPSSLSISELKRGVADPTLLMPMPWEFLRRAVYGSDEYASYLLDVFGKKAVTFEEPWFAFVNVTITHSPYDPPRPYKETAVPELERPRFGFFDRFGTERIEHSDVRIDNIREAQGPEGFAKFRSENQHYSDNERDILRSLYGASVRYLDDQLADLFGTLNTAGALDDTIVVLLSDHGEYLGEHGMTGHMFLHFSPCLHVPLIISGPGVPAGECRSDLVSLVDVFPTLCDCSGIDCPPAVDGHSLFGGQNRDAVFAENGVRDTPAVYNEYLPAEEVDRLKQGLKSIRTVDHLYTIDSAGEERLYEGPDETEVENPDSDTLAAYRKRIHATLGKEYPPGSQDDEYGEAIEENLRHLGYLS